MQNVGIIKNSTIKLDGLTIICGNNNSGKSTFGKALYATIESLSNLDEKLHDELVQNYRRAVMSVSRILDLNSVVKYVNFDKLQEDYRKDFSMLIQDTYRFQTISQYTNVVDAYIALKEAVEIISPQLLIDFASKPKSDWPKKFIAFTNNIEENRSKALSILNSLSKYYFDENLRDFAEKSVAALFSSEFKGQVFPVNLKAKERKSSILITKKDEMGCHISIFEKINISAVVHNDKLFLNNAIYLDDPYALDKLIEDNEITYFLRRSSIDHTHFGKLSRILLSTRRTTLIEESINKEKYDTIINKISDVIPGVLNVRDSAVYYEERDKEPLRVQNLATGSKMFSIIKTLMEKGEIGFDTMLILDEPESHLHPEWQNILAEIIVLIVKEFDTHVLLTTHSPNFLMAIEAFSKKHNLIEKTNYYMASHNSDNYMVDYSCINDNLSKIYASFARPLVEVKQLKDI